MTKAPAPQHDLLTRIATLEAKVQWLMQEKMFDAIELHRDRITVEEAAKLVGRSTVTIRYWCRNDRIGTKDSKKRYQVNRSQLKRYLIERFGAEQLPAALRD
jgi:excisionase family DNA binding protein